MLCFDEFVVGLDFGKLFLLLIIELDRILKEFDKFKVFEDKFRSVGEKKFGGL